MAAVDLLRAGGLERGEAQKAVSTATRRTVATER